MSDYTARNLDDVPDSAPDFGFGEIGAARFATEHLGCAATGLAYHAINPGMRQAFGHRHDAAEEVVVVIGGSGRVRLDDDLVELAPLDAVRIAPGVARRFEAGADGLRYVVFGPKHPNDGELLPEFWSR